MGGLNILGCIIIYGIRYLRSSTDRSSGRTVRPLVGALSQQTTWLSTGSRRKRAFSGSSGSSTTAARAGRFWLGSGRCPVGRRTVAVMDCRRSFDPIDRKPGARIDGEKSQKRAAAKRPGRKQNARLRLPARRSAHGEKSRRPAAGHVVTRR